MASSIVRRLVASISLKHNKKGFVQINDSIRNIQWGLQGVIRLADLVGRGFEAIIIRGAQLEQSTISFQALTKNVALGNKLLAELNTLAADTTFNVPEARKYASMMIAMGISTDKIIPTMKVFGDVLGGLPNLTLERLALNFGQVKAQGHLTARELRDFAVGGVPILEALVETTGKAANQIKDMISKKLVSFDMVEEAFRYMTGSQGRFNKLLEKQSSTTLGLWKILKSNIHLISEAIGAEMVPAFKEILQDTIAWIKANKDLLKSGFSKMLTTIVSLVFTLVKAFTLLIKPVVAIIDYFKVYNEETQTTNNRLFYLIAVLGTLGFALAALSAGSMASAISKFIALRAASFGVAAGINAVNGALTGSALLKVMGAAGLAAGKIALVASGLLAVVLMFESANTFFTGKALGIETRTAFGDLTKDLPKVRTAVEFLIASVKILSASVIALLEWDLKALTENQQINGLAIVKFAKEMENLRDTMFDSVDNWMLGLLERMVNALRENYNILASAYNKGASMLPFGSAVRMPTVDYISLGYKQPQNNTSSSSTVNYVTIDGAGPEVMTYLEEMFNSSHAQSDGSVKRTEFVTAN